MSELTYERAKQLYTPYDEGQMRHLCALRDVEIDRLRVENAKLHELVRGLWFAAQYLGMNPNGATGRGFARQMCELRLGMSLEDVCTEVVTAVQKAEGEDA